MRQWFKWFKFPAWTGVFFAILSVAIIGIILIYGYGLPKIPPRYQNAPEIVLPILVIVGTIGLLASLAFLAGGLAALGLADKSRALGLPEGSVRALIALLLLTFFVIIAVFLYGQIRRPLKNVEDVKYIGIVEERLAQIPSEQLVSVASRTEVRDSAQKTVYDVTRRLPAIYSHEVSEKFAQQILTAIITLVTALVAFYFGTKSVEVSRGLKAPLKPVILDINHHEGKKGDVLDNIEILGKDFESPSEVKLKSGLEEMTCVDVTSSTTKIRCKLTIPGTQQIGHYDLIVVNTNGEEGMIPKTFEVK